MFCPPHCKPSPSAFHRLYFPPPVCGTQDPSYPCCSLSPWRTPLGPSQDPPRSPASLPWGPAEAEAQGKAGACHRELRAGPRPAAILLSSRLFNPEPATVSSTERVLKLTPAPQTCPDTARGWGQEPGRGGRVLTTPASQETALCLPQESWGWLSASHISSVSKGRKRCTRSSSR